MKFIVIENLVTSFFPINYRIFYRNEIITEDGKVQMKILHYSKFLDTDASFFTMIFLIVTKSSLKIKIFK